MLIEQGDEVQALPGKVFQHAARRVVPRKVHQDEIRKAFDHRHVIAQIVPQVPAQTGPGFRMRRQQATGRSHQVSRSGPDVGNIFGTEKHGEVGKFMGSGLEEDGELGDLADDLRFGECCVHEIRSGWNWRKRDGERQRIEGAAIIVKIPKASIYFSHFPVTLEWC